MPSDEEIRQVLLGKGLSEWFKTALLSVLGGDPVQVAHNAVLLSVVLDRLAQSITAGALASKAIAEARGG